MTALQSSSEHPTRPDYQVLVEDCEARINIYRFLSRLFLEEISPELLDQLCDPNLAAQFKDAGCDFSSTLSGDDKAALLEELSTAYCSNFVIPTEMSQFPLESCQREKRLNGDSTMAVEDTYEKFGYGLPEQSGLIADHLGLELDFMANLAERTRKNLENNNFAEAEQIDDAQRQFLKEHLLVWVPRFAKNLVRLGTHPFYCRLGEITYDFIQFEAEGFEISNHGTKAE